MTDYAEKLLRCQRLGIKLPPAPGNREFVPRGPRNLSKRRTGGHYDIVHDMLASGQSFTVEDVEERVKGPTSRNAIQSLLWRMVRDGKAIKASPPTRHGIVRGEPVTRYVRKTV